MDQTQLQAFVKSAVANMENANPSGNPYQSIVSTGNSQLSFGAMQLDVGNNTNALQVFTQIMNTRVGVGGWTQVNITDLIDKAKTAASTITPTEKTFIDAALAANTTIVDQADAQQLTKVMGYVNGALAAAASNPNGPGELNSTAPDPQFITELAAWGNRTGGLAATDAFLATASNVSQSVYDSAYLSQQTQFTKPGANETIESNAQRVAAAANYSLNKIGATVTSFSLTQQEANSIGANGTNVNASSGSSDLAIYKDSSGNSVGTLWNFSTPGSNTGTASLSLTTNPITNSAGNVIGTGLAVSGPAGGFAFALSKTGTVTSEQAYQTNTLTSITTEQHYTGGVLDSRGLIVGDVTQAKLDQVSLLSGAITQALAQAGSSPAATNPATNPTANPVSNPAAQTLSISSLLGDLGINNLGSDATSYLDTSFNKEAAINNICFAPPNYALWIQNDMQQASTDSSNINLSGGTDLSLPAQDLYPIAAALDAGTGTSPSADGGVFTNPADAQAWADGFQAQSALETAQAMSAWYSFWGSYDGNCGFGYEDPLVLNLAGGQVRTTGLIGSKVSFDMAANGQTVKTAWITPDEGFLVMERNGIAGINDASEMFSEHTSKTAGTGFAALAELNSNGDGVIDRNDTAFSQLKVWVDKNADGVSQASELYTLDKLKIASIDLHQTARNLYDNGNVILGGSTFTRSDGSKGDIADGLFSYGNPGNVSTVYVTDQSTAVRLSNGKVVEVLSGGGAQAVNAARSGVNVLVGGQGDILNVGSSSNAILIGNGGTILVGNTGNTSFIATGAGNTITCLFANDVNFLGDALQLGAVGDAVNDVMFDMRRIA